MWHCYSARPLIPASFHLVEEEHCARSHSAASHCLFFSILMLVTPGLYFCLCVLLTWHILPRPFMLCQWTYTGVVLCFFFFNRKWCHNEHYRPQLPNTLSRACCMATIACRCQEDLWNVISFGGEGCQKKETFIQYCRKILLLSVLCPQMSLIQMNARSMSAGIFCLVRPFYSWKLRLSNFPCTE